MARGPPESNWSLLQSRPGVARQARGRPGRFATRLEPPLRARALLRYQAKGCTALRRRCGIRLRRGYGLRAPPPQTKTGRGLQARAAVAWARVCRPPGAAP